MSKKKIPHIPNDSTVKTTNIQEGRITEVRNDCVIAEFFGASQLLPINRFVKESDSAKLCVGAKIKVNRYFSNSKKIIAYNAELLTDE